MGLAAYRGKRNFGVTPEPRGRRAASRAGALSFVVQKHAASHLHYDFRLECDGVLLSWAVPKGPSLDPADKRLAVEVEDHPLEYGTFEGIIPPHQYGSGTVMVWDRGTWIPDGDPAKARAAGRIAFTLEGEKLRGRWTLVRTRGGAGAPAGKAWLLIKHDDAYAQHAGASIVDTAPESAATGRSLDEIAAAPQRVWNSSRPAAKLARAAPVAKPPAAQPQRGERAARVPAPGARKARIPALIAPALATLVRSVPSGPGWIHEIKYDGYRMVCRIERGKARLYSRSGRDWTAHFPAVARDLAALPVKTAWLDGEVVAVDEHGKVSFQALQNMLSAGAGAQPLLFAFDLMHQDGYDLRGVALRERKRLLRAVVGAGVGTIRMGPEQGDAGDDFARQACALGLEGIVCKRAESTYRDGTRSGDWVKVKCTRRQEMVIGGYTEPQGAREGFGALLVGYYEDGRLRYSGKVGTGFDTATLRALLPMLQRRTRESPPFVDPPRGHEARGARWVTPDLVAEVAFTEWSDAGALRHPSFRGLRADKKARDVVRERAQDAPTSAVAARPRRAAHSVAKSAATARAQARQAALAAPHADPAPRAARAARKSGDIVAGIALTHPDKPYFPEAQITKRDVAEYYAAIAPRLLPHLAGRPLSLLRCPDGRSGECFYQKHVAASLPAALPRIKVPEGDGSAVYAGANSARSLATLVQWGTIELHPWGARTPRLDRPDRLIFDFDPDEALPWTELATGVGLLRTLLDELRLTGFLKTTGGKGLHVVVPIARTLSWEEAKGYTKAIAQFLATTFPDRFTASLGKARRNDRIFIDYLRNAQGATAIAPYAVRARANAPVATPLAWDELAGADPRFDRYSLASIGQRIASEAADPWAQFFAIRQAITAAMRRRFG